MARKKAIPEATRRAVATAAGCEPGQTIEAHCSYCGAGGQIVWHRKADGTPSSWVSFVDLELDHRHPEHLGGLATPDNIVLACRPCNRRKGHRPL